MDIELRHRSPRPSPTRPSPPCDAPTDARAASVRSAAVRIAPCQVVQSANSDQPAAWYRVTVAGSYTCTSPWRLRHPIVSSIRWPLVEATTTGPAHSTMAGTATPLVLPEWAGPTTSRL
jgi:hypothetical protein